MTESQKNHEQKQAENFVMTPEIWESLNIGDTINVEKPMKGILTTTVLQREDGLTTLSMLSANGPCSVTLVKCRFSEDHQCIVDTDDEPLDFLRAITDIDADAGKQAVEIYTDRQTNASPMSQEQYDDIMAGLEIQKKAITEILQEKTLDTFPKKASSVLDVILGKGNFTDEHVCCLSVMMMFFEHKLGQMQMKMQMQSLVGSGMPGMHMMGPGMMNGDGLGEQDLASLLRGHLLSSDHPNCDGDCENCSIEHG
jgi:hypothetical protein